MKELAALISSSTVHDRLRWDVETQFRQTRSNGWVWPGVGAHQTVNQWHNGARIIWLMGEDTCLSLVTKALVRPVLANEVPRIAIFCPISFPKRLEVDNKVFPEHLPSRCQLCCHKTGCREKLNNYCKCKDD